MIKNIVLSCPKMLDKTQKVSEERLQLINFIRETFGRYLAPQVVDQILESPDGLKIGGKREIVTILISDLRGFTSLSETKDPEEMVILLNRYLKRMSEIIIAYDGIIDEFIGDAILAIFGITERHEDHAAKAVACSLEMQNALFKLNKEIEKEGYPHLEMGIGINTGAVLVGNIGSEIRMKFGIVGSPVAHSLSPAVHNACFADIKANKVIIRDAQMRKAVFFILTSPCSCRFFHNFIQYVTDKFNFQAETVMRIDIFQPTMAVVTRRN